MTFNVIAEIGSNWEGSIELAKEHIKEAKQSGATYVKFQMWRAEDLYDKNHPQWETIKKSELTENVAIELKKYSDQIGIEWFCSVFNPESVEFLEKLNVKIYKIASRTSKLKDRFSLETIKKVSETRKTTFISTGEGADKNKISEMFEAEKIQFTYCVSKYPTMDSDINWKEVFNYNFFSDHTMGITIPLIYAIKKKFNSNADIFIEKHTRFADSKGPDSSFAITYDELKELNSHLKRIENVEC